MPAKIAYLDCSAGVNNSLLLAALLDIGLVPAEIEQQLAGIPYLASYRLNWRKAGSYGSSIGGTTLAPDPALTIAEWQTIFLSLHSDIYSSLRRSMLTILQRLSDASTHLQDDGPALSASDIAIACSVIVAIQRLQVQMVYSSPLALSSRCSPLVVEIGRSAGLLWQAGSPADISIPSGALDVALLATCTRLGRPELRIESVGYGLLSPAGLQETVSRASACLLVLYVGYEEDAVRGAESNVSRVAGEVERDRVAVIETNIDNMGGELLGGLMERLFAAGALDVTYTPIQMKKNRPATQVTVICPPKSGEQLALLLLRETTTLGVRLQVVERRKAQRTQLRISTELGPVLVKVKRLEGAFVGATPEYEECQRLAREHDLPLIEVYEIVRDAIRHADELAVK